MRPGLYGFDEADMRLLSASEAQQISGMTDVLGAVFTPALRGHPPQHGLARGLAAVLRARGVRIYEKTRGSAAQAQDNW